MDNLIARVEAATGPSRELDAEIFIRVKHPTWRLQTGCEPFPDEVKPGRIQEPDGFAWREAPTYTASLDAAMTLVPNGEGRWPQVYYVGPNPNNQRQGHRWSIWLKGKAEPVKGHHKDSSALALCAAALRSIKETDRDYAGT